MHRDDDVIVYMDKNTEQIYCRICAASMSERGGTTNHDYFHNGWICASKRRWITHTFDNTKHTILISRNTCKVCELRGQQCVGMDNCPGDIKLFLNVVLDAIPESRREY